MLIHMNLDQFCKLRIIGACRNKLRSWKMMGLHQALCLKALFSQLPALLLSQYNYEKTIGKIKKENTCIAKISIEQNLRTNKLTT